MNASVAATSLATATAVALPIETDPIYAAIEVHRIAKSAREKELDRYAEAGEQDPPRARVLLFQQPKIEYSSVTNDRGELVSRARRTDEIESKYAHYPEEIERYARADYFEHKDRREAWIAEKCTELEGETKRLEDEFIKTPAGKIWADERAASEKELEAQSELFNTTPTTIQGLFALITYIRSSDDLAQCLQDGGDTSSNLAALFERSLCHIQGLPAPPAWFDDEEADTDTSEDEQEQAA